MGREMNETLWILHSKIFIVGVLVDEIEREYPWPTESRENLPYFKQKTGKTPQFMKMWIESLGDLFKQQKIKLHELMIAEMKNEHSRHEKRVNVAEILRKPHTAMTAEDTKAIAARVIAEEMPSGSYSCPDTAKGTKVEGDASKGVPRAAPAVVRRISKAPPGEPPGRPTPPIDPPAKWAKGASKGAAEWVPSGLRKDWKGKSKRGEKGRFDDGPPVWNRPPENQGFGYLPAPPPYTGPARNEPPDSARQAPIRRNPYRDVREVDRHRRERANEPPNPAYLEWHDAAWKGQSPFPHADDRGYGRNDDHHAGARGPSSGWTPSIRTPPYRVGRNRTRSPYGHPPNNRDRRRDDDWEPSRDQRDCDENDWARHNERFQHSGRGW